MRVDKAGNVSTFFTPPIIKHGLSAALGVLSNGLWWSVIFPPRTEPSATAQAGTLTFVNSNGQLIGTLATQPSSAVLGAWRSTIPAMASQALRKSSCPTFSLESFSRININYSSTTISATAFVLAAGFNHRADPAALEVGPAGMAYNAANDTLYVASSADNAIYEIPTATKAPSPISPTLLLQDDTHLHGPLDISILPDGNLVVANSDGSNVDPNQPSELVEYTPTGTFLAQQSVDPNNGGAFGVAIQNLAWGAFRMAAVDDNTNTLHIWTAVAP